MRDNSSDIYSGGSLVCREFERSASVVKGGICQTISDFVLVAIYVLEGHVLPMFVIHAIELTKDLLVRRVSDTDSLCAQSVNYVLRVTVDEDTDIAVLHICHLVFGQPEMERKSFSLR